MWFPPPDAIIPPEELVAPLTSLDEDVPCRIDKDGEDPEALEIVLDLNMLGFRMGKGPVDGDDDRGDDVPAIGSLIDIKDDDDEFILSLRSRLTANPVGEGLGPMLTELGFMDGKGLGGGIKALVPILALVPMAGGSINLSATEILSTPGMIPPPAEVARAI